MTIQVDIEKAPAVDPKADELAGKAPAAAGGKELPAAAAPETKTVPEVERPAGLPDKFDTVAAMVESYNALEAKQSSDGKVVDPLSLEGGAGGDDPKTKGLNWKQFETEFIADGQLSEASVKMAVDAGIPKDFIDGHMLGLEAQKNAQVDAMLDIAGGGQLAAVRKDSQEKFDAMKTWAKANLPESDKQAFAASMGSGDPGQMANAMKGLVARFAGSPAGQADPIEGPTSGSAVQPFASAEEMTKAMSHPDYDRLPEFRAKVEARIKAGLTGAKVRIR